MKRCNQLQVFNKESQLQSRSTQLCALQFTCALRNLKSFLAHLKSSRVPLKRLNTRIASEAHEASIEACRVTLHWMQRCRVCALLALTESGLAKVAKVGRKTPNAWRTAQKFSAWQRAKSAMKFSCSLLEIPSVNPTVFNQLVRRRDTTHVYAEKKVL